MATVLAWLLLTVGLSVQGAGLSSAAELSRLDLAEAAPGAEVVTEQPAQWRDVRTDVPPSEVTALEPELDGDPAAPDSPSLIRAVFSREQNLRSDAQMLQGATATYVAKFASSPALARAPPASPRADA